MTIWPSLKKALTSWPWMRAFTETVELAITVPMVRSITDMVRCSTGATLTGAAVTILGLVPVPAWVKYQKPPSASTRATPPSRYLRMLLPSEASTAAPGSAGLAWVGLV